ncbi:MAG: hypothetical protein OEZ03_06940 [Alphaproteobacteria bacterium]|nr:hypothetical protein [Alphaproteobacteria bacterium]
MTETLRTRQGQDGGAAGRAVAGNRRQPGCLTADLLAALMRAMGEALVEMQAGRHPDNRLFGFEDLRPIVRFEDNYDEDDRYTIASLKN